MTGYLARRVGASVVMLLALTSATFVLVYASGADIARSLLGDLATPAQVAAKATELGLDRPLPVRYGEWIVRALRGDLGTSWQSSLPVLDLVVARLPVTLSLVAVTTIVASALATALGVVAAVRAGWVDRAVQLLALLGSALPGFVVAIVLVTVFAVRLRLFPATGFVDPSQGAGAWLASLALPCTALVVGVTATAAQQIRGAMKDTLQAPWIIAIRSHGVAERTVVWRHALRQAAPAGLTVFSLQFVALLSGTVVIEQVFALPGIGTLAIGATSAGDLPVVMGVVVYSVLIVVAVTFVIDLLGGLLIPRVRSAS